MKRFVCQRIKAVRHRKYEYLCVILGVLLVLLIPVVVFFIAKDLTDDWKRFIPSLVAFISLVFFLQKHRLEKLRLFTDLFKEFNERYDKLNDDLNKIRKNHPKPLEKFDSEFKANSNHKDAKGVEDVLFDYFNLCAEEYLYYKRGYILLEVWEAWENGMKTFFKDDRIRELWEEDKDRTNSYYGFEPPTNGQV